MTDSDTWGQLVSLTDIETDPIMLSSNSFIIGRSKDCDLSYIDNKLVSSKHCCIQRDEDGKVWLCDTSTNGTLLNLKSKITKGNKKELQHGDEFYVVYKKGEDEKNIGFVYQSMEELAKEDSSGDTLEYDTDANILDATVTDVDVNVLDEEPEDTTRKRPKEVDRDDDEPKKKLKKIEDSEEIVKDCKLEETHIKCSGDMEVVKTTETNDKTKEEISKEEESKLKREKVTNIPAAPLIDEIEETLLCSICQELLYNCVSLQPCMHSYCAGCYSDWMLKSNECPTCRMKVKRINKNHIVNNLIEAYLKEHPEKKRPEEDLKLLDAKNKITKDMLTPTAKQGYDADDDDDAEDFTDSDDEAEEPRARIFPPPLFANIHLPAPAPAPAPMLFGFGTPFFGTRQAMTKCRQCPGYVPPPNVPPPPGIIQTALTAVGTALGLNLGGNQAGVGETQEAESVESAEAGPSTKDEPKPVADPELKDEKVNPAPPDFVCGPAQNHVLCQCCLQPMPDRRAEGMNDNDRVPSQQCRICYRAYCHAYWGCNKNECMGCIGKFKDLNFGKKCLKNLILENIFESEIFENYLAANGITVKQVLKESLLKLEAGQYTCPDQARFAINSNTALCYTCGLRNFKELAYQYRRDIPREDFSEDVQKRQDCYWGKNCRTQKTKPHHAKNFSHICDQIRTT